MTQPAEQEIASRLPHEVESARSAGTGALDVLVALAERLKWLMFLPVLAALLAFGIASVLPKTYTARTIFLPPQQQQGSAAAALAGLGALGGLAAGTAALRTPADQYASLLRSVRVADRIIVAFKLTEVYDEPILELAREELDRRLRVMVGRRDGLITVEVDDESPARAADMANRMVEELRRLTAALALTEAQQRRVFFEERMTQTRQALVSAQRALEASGFAGGALKAEPRAAADNYARLRAEVTAAEVRLQTLRRTFTESAQETQQVATTLAALRSQLNNIENSQAPNASDYLGKYRDFKYQETLYDMFARQYEIARVDEGRESNLIQVVDIASAPERKSGPKRGLIAMLAGVGVLVATMLWIVLRAMLNGALARDGSSAQWARLRSALRPGA